MKITAPLRTLCVGACAAFLFMELAAADSPREHLSLDANWKFHLGDDWPDALHRENSGTGSGPEFSRCILARCQLAARLGD
jgi:hypothetical protein